MSFSFKGLSSEYLGLATRVTKMPYIPKKRITTIPILGKDGGVVFEDAYDNVEIVIRCAFIDTDIQARRDKARLIAYWLTDLSTGTTLNISINNTSTETFNYKVVQCVHDMYSEFNPSLPSEEFDITFVCRPWHMTAPIITDYTMQALTPLDTNITNYGFYKTPINLKLEVVFGVASMTLTWGTKSMTLSNMQTGTPVYIDSEKMLVYTGTTTKVNKMKDFSGDFMVINAVTSTDIRVTSTANSVSKVQFSYAEAYL